MTERALYTVQSIRKVLHYDALQKEPESYGSVKKLRETGGIHRPELDGTKQNGVEYAGSYDIVHGSGSVNPYSYPCRRVRASDLWCRRRCDVRYQTHSIIQSFCNNHSPIPQRYKTALIKFYISLACIDPSGFTTQAGSYAEMVLEMNNTKAILLDVLKSGFKSCSELDQAITTFASFCSAVGDHSNDFISLHADILSWLGKTYYIQGAFSEAEAFIQKALKYHSLSSHMQGIGDDLAGLGAIYLH